MDESDWNIPKKPYDVRERLLLFGCTVVRLVQYLHTRGPVAVELSGQLLRCGTSAGANYEEADSASSERDRWAKRKITLRELKETRFRLRILRKTGFLAQIHDPVLIEAEELMKIVAAIIRRSEGK